MTLADDVDLEEYIMAKDDLSGADIKVTSNTCLTFVDILYTCPISYLNFQEHNLYTLIQLIASECTGNVIIALLWC